MLLSTTVFTWTDSDQDHLWSNPDNWNDSSGNPVSSAPNSAYDQVVFTAGTSDTVDVDNDYTIGSLIVQGGSNIDLDFDADGRTLSITQNGDFTGGWIDLDQTAGQQTSFTISNDNAPAFSQDTVTADELDVTGDVTGSTSLAINYNLTLSLNDDLNAGPHQISLNDSGTVDAGNAYFLGKNMPLTGAPDVSNLAVSGQMDLTGELRVGGIGKVQMAVDEGVVQATELYVPTVSSVDVKDDGWFMVWDKAYLGDPAGHFTVPIQLNGLSGARLTAESGSTVSVATSINIKGGNQAELLVEGGAGVWTEDLIVSEGDSGSQSPLVKVTGVGSTLMVTDTARFTTAVAGSAPRIEVHSSGQFIVDTDNGSGTLVIGAASEQGSSQLLVDTGGYATAQWANFAAVGNGGGSYAKITITGGGSSLEVFRSIQIGDGVRHAASLSVTDTATVVAADLYKVVGADVKGWASITAFVHSLGTGADFIPGGDGDPTGTLTIIGVLDACEGMTLDSYLDPGSGHSSLLDVTGAATIAGTIAFYTPADTDSDAFSAGQSYTVLETGTLSGTFSNLAAGVQPVPSTDGSTTPLLPILPVGLRWLATYSSTELVLSVIAISPATNIAATTAPLSADTTYLGDRSVTITWTNNDPGITATYIEVKEGDGSGDEGNYFTVGYVTGNTNTFSDIPGDDNTDTFQAGATYSIRLRTLTTAGAAYSDVYTYSVPPITTDGSLAISYSADPDNPTGFAIDLSGQDTSAVFALLAQSGTGPFPDRWDGITSPQGEAYGGDPDLGILPRNGYGDVRVAPASADPTNFLIVQQNSTATTSADANTPPFSFALDTPQDVTASYTSSGVNLSWDAVTGAIGYYVVDLSDFSQTATYHYVDTTHYTAINVPSHGFSRGGYYAVIAWGEDDSYNPEWSAVSSFVDDSKAAEPDVLVTTVSDKAIKITWDNAAYNEEGYVVERSVDGGAYAAVGVPVGGHVTVGADVGEYTDTDVSLGHTYQYEVVAYRGSTDASLSSTGGAGVAAKLAVPFAALKEPPQVNDGSPSRSMVTSVTLTFNQPVTLGTGAITIAQQQSDGSDPVVMPIAVNNPSGDGVTWVVTFTDPMYVDGSLPDGTYSLTINAGAVTSTLTGQTGVQDQTVSFYRVYGDVSGDGTVDGTDISIVEDGSGTAGDVNGDGVVDYMDLILVYETQGDHA